MKSTSTEFAPLNLERAEELNDIINRAGAHREAVILDPEDRGIASAAPTDLISPNENTNALVRYQRHY